MNHAWPGVYQVEGKIQEQPSQIHTVYPHLPLYLKNFLSPLLAIITGSIVGAALEDSGGMSCASIGSYVAGLGLVNLCQASWDDPLRTSLQLRARSTNCFIFTIHVLTLGRQLLSLLPWALIT